MRKNREYCKVSVRNGGSKHPPYGARVNVPFRKIITVQKHRGERSGAACPAWGVENISQSL